MKIGKFEVGRKGNLLLAGIAVRPSELPTLMVVTNSPRDLGSDHNRRLVSEGYLPATICFPKGKAPTEGKWYELGKYHSTTRGNACLVEVGKEVEEPSFLEWLIFKPLNTHYGRSGGIWTATPLLCGYELGAALDGTQWEINWKPN